MNLGSLAALTDGAGAKAQSHAKKISQLVNQTQALIAPKNLLLRQFHGIELAQKPKASLNQTQKL